MAKKLVVVLSIIIIILAIVLYFMARTPEPIEFSDNPEDWVKKEGTNQVIDVPAATELQGFFDASGVQLRYPGLVTALSLEGAYQGTSFNRQHITEEGRILMRISPEINPNDGIIEGFILERKENEKLVAYLFVDADWRAEVRPTNIYWGKFFDSNREYNFEEVAQGIYLDRIEEDLDRFSDDYKTHIGGIILGDVTPEDTAGKTYIKLV